MSYVYPDWWNTITADFIMSHSNGCGPGSWKLDIIPDKIAGVDIERWCRQHDIEYLRGKDRLGADLRLLINILWACYEQKPEKMWLLAPVAFAFFYAVRRHGAEHFAQ